MSPSVLPRRLERIVKGLFFIAIFATAFFLVYNQVFNSGKVSPDGTTGYESDTLEHIEILKDFFEEGTVLPHPMWHLLVKLFSFLTAMSVETSAVVISALLVTLWSFLVYRVVASMLGSVYPSELLFLTVTFVIITIGPLCVPFYEKIIYLGQGSPNVWHNVTLWTVKPFALVAVWTAVIALHKRQMKYYCFALVSTSLSLLAKPSFVIIFLPSLLALIVSRHYFTYRNSLFYLVLAGIALVILSYQYSITFGAHSKIVVDFLGVWSMQSSNVVVSILLALAFPLLLLHFHPKVIENDYIFLSWVQVLLGIMLFALFAEAGSRYTHGNFGWSYIIALGFLYLFSVIEYAKDFKQIVFAKRWILLLLLSLQTLIGVYYLVRVLQGQHPLFIAIMLG
ncbi:hypothetical protein WCX49_03085 [Sulfurimonas sp. HSL-1656]|uniref:hypothetical protein n=1 Tax=Thiomicrolovo subterrani TaxID=3131934 RepID=UPI0031F82A21